MRPLFQSLADGPAEVAPILAMAFLYIVDAPQTRPYVNSGTDLEVNLSFPYHFVISTSDEKNDILPDCYFRDY